MTTTGDPPAARRPIPPHEITGVVLCGGEGRRLGCVEKPLLALHGAPLVAHVLERLVPQVGRVIISANRELEGYRALGHDVVTDVEPGLGPLGGLSSVAPHVTTPWLFCCPGDAPRISRHLVARLSETLTDSCVAAYPHDGERPQYLFLLARTAACSSLAGYLGSGGRSVRGWLAMNGADTRDLHDLHETFVNVNTADDLLRIR